MKIKRTKFKYCKDDKVDNFVVGENKNNNPDWNDGLAENHSLREIAYQLKRIADLLMTIVSEA